MIAQATHPDVSEQARRRFIEREGRPFLIADWTSAVFIHFEVPADELSCVVPFEVDLWNGRAFVSLVAFTMRRMRLARFGRFGEWLFKGIATHEFLNLRTYVRHGEDSGICFLAEWLPNPLSVWLGPRIYGLPYQRANIRYRHDGEAFAGSVSGRTHRLAYHGRRAARELSPVAEETLDQFLLERYAAFNAGHLIANVNGSTPRRVFRVWHSPWPQVCAQVEIEDDSLLRRIVPWWTDAKLVSANFSPGVRDVWMSAPHKI
jgi:uncharacterized protein